MSAHPTSQFPSISFVIHQAEASNIYVTVHWQSITNHGPQNLNATVAAAAATVPSQPQATNHNAVAAATTSVAVLSQPQPAGVAVTTSPVRRVGSAFSRAIQSFRARFRPRDT